MKGKVVIASALLFSQTMLTGCAYNPFIRNNHTTGDPAGAVIGAGAGVAGVALLNGPKPLMVLAGIGGAALGYYVTTLRFDAGNVIQSGGQVYRIGDRVGIDIPADKLFEPNTADFVPGSSAILDSAATVLARYPNNNILVSGNTSGFNRVKRELTLSEKRAKQVAAYLWNAGINQNRYPDIGTRKLNYVGYGDYFPIANRITNEGLRQNSHIQITSYPSNKDLEIDNRHIVMANVGDPNQPVLDDHEDKSANTDDSCDSNIKNCFKDR